MAPATSYIDEVFPLKDNDVERVRSVPGVSWAVPFYDRTAEPKPITHVNVLLNFFDELKQSVPVH